MSSIAFPEVYTGSSMTRNEMPVPIDLDMSILQAMAFTIRYIEVNEFSCGSDIISEIMMSKRPQEIKWQLAIPQAREMLDFWRFNFIQEKLMGSKLHMGRWHEGIIDMVKDIDKPANTENIKLIVTLPKYTKIQRQTNDLMEKYLPWNKIVTDHPVKLQLVDTVDRGSSNKRNAVWYYFVDEAQQLYVMELALSDRSTHLLRPMIEKILKDNQGFLTAKIHCGIKRIGRDFDVGTIYQIDDLQ